MYILFMREGDFMNTHLKKIGNSKGIIIPAAILKLLDIKESEELTVKVEGKDIILSKVNSFDPKSLEELFLDCQETYNGNIIFDDSKGREIW
jgi:antitoxin component of MazEF toxin-antitoxin module